jgi:hypothetical protein
MTLICKFLLFFICTTPLQATLIYQKTVDDFVLNFPDTQVIQCTKDYSFNHNPFPLYQKYSQKYFPASGQLTDVFIIQIPQATAYFDKKGYVFINDCFIKETQLKDLNFFNNQNFINQENEIIQNINVSGKVAIISHLYPYCYGLYVFDMLSQLALLELYNIEYDYLCIPYYEKFMQEFLELWQIDHNKIIPLTRGVQINASTIIMPTSISQEKTYAKCANYYVDFLLKYVREKIIQSIQSTNQTSSPEKIFISRKDAGGKRAIPNEDEVFALFEPLGFVRYELTPLSVAEKVALFYHAKAIVSFVGSGSTNIMFCKPGTHYIEISQKMIDATFYFITDMLQIKYSSINNSILYNLYYGGPWSTPAPLSLDCVKKFIANHPEL